MSIGGAFACCKLQVYSKDLDVFFYRAGRFFANEIQRCICSYDHYTYYLRSAVPQYMLVATPAGGYRKAR